jgi:hypothetical protein
MSHPVLTLFFICIFFMLHVSRLFCFLAALSAAPPYQQGLWAAAAWAAAVLASVAGSDVEANPGVCVVDSSLGAAPVRH